MTTKKWTLFLASLLFIVTGCKSDSEDDGAATNGSVTPGIIDAAGGFNVKVNRPFGTNYFIHKTGDFEADCSVASTATAIGDTDIECIVEIEELEGAFNGVSMVMNAPPAMCTYIRYTPYFFFGLEYGVGPSAATVNLDLNGKLKSGSSVVGPGTLSPTGEVKCNYDYEGPPARNCCLGSYTLTTVQDIEGGGTSTTIETKPWGGKPGNCAAGTGAKSAPRIESTNMPASVYYFKPNGFNDEFITEKRSIIDGASSLYYANYYSGVIPNAFKDGDSYPGNPYYEWVCLDDAEEIRARIRVQIREWNDIDEFALEATGDPDTGGVEPGFGTAINDFPDWLDITNGGNGFPGVPQD
jgi:hypothetical protein